MASAVRLCMAWRCMVPPNIMFSIQLVISPTVSLLATQSELGRDITPIRALPKYPFVAFASVA
jgi:hypothetical protein